MSGDITVISGPTAVGKGTVVSALRLRCPELWVSVSATTRAPRPLERDGVDYLFDLSSDERERANRARREPDRLASMRDAWEGWNATMPPVPDDATVSLGYSTQDMPQR